MALPILEIPKRYKDGQPYFEAFVDDIKFSTEEWALAIVRSMNQFGQDVFGSNYPFNNNGLPTRVIPLIDYLAALSENETVTGNWTFSGSTTFGNVTFGGTITVAGAAVFNGTATFNQAVTFNSTSSFVGKITAVDVDVNGVLRIQDSTNTFYYTFVPSALAANRNITLPILAADDVFVFADFIQTLNNKTLVTPTIASFVNATHNHLDNAGGGTLSLPASVITSGTFDDARISQSSVTQYNSALDHGALAGLGDNDHTQYPLKASTETISGNWTFSNPILLNDTDTHISRDNDEIHLTMNGVIKARFPAVAEDSGNTSVIFNVNSTGDSANSAYVQISNSRRATLSCGVGTKHVLTDNTDTPHTAGGLILNALNTWTSTTSTHNSGLALIISDAGLLVDLITSDSDRNVNINGLLSLDIDDPPAGSSFMSNRQHKGFVFYDASGNSVTGSYNVVGVTEETSGDDRYIIEWDANLTSSVNQCVHCNVFTTSDAAWCGKIYDVSTLQAEITVTNGGTNGHTLSQSIMVSVIN